MLFPISFPVISTVLAESSSLKLIVSSLAVNISSFLMVTVAVLVICTDKLVPVKLFIETVRVSSASGLSSTVGVRVNVFVSPAVPVKVKV